MTERDAFEVRFEAAVRGYVGRVSSDLDPAELAHRIAGAEPRRHGLAAALTGRHVAAPRLAWVLLLVAALLGLVAGTLAVGSRLLESTVQRPAVLDGMVTEEVEPGVFRVASDGIRDLTSVDNRDVVAGYEDGIWLLRNEGFLRLGSDRIHEWPDGAGPESHVLQVAPDGTLWVIPGRSVFRLEGRGEGLRSIDGEAWTVQPCPGDYCRGVTVAPDGTVWASWSWDDAWACELGNAEGCEWWLGNLGPTGWQRLGGSTPGGDLGFERLVFTDAGDFYGVQCAWSCGLYRYEDGAWRQVNYASNVDVGPDGTVWQHGGLVWPEGSIEMAREDLARFAGGAWEAWTPTDLPEIKDSVGLDGQFRVGPDGSLWFSMVRIDPPPTDTGPTTFDPIFGPAVGDTWCDGLARFDGETLDRFLRGQCVSMDIASDGSVWVLAGEDDVDHEDVALDLYVIAPRR